MTADGNWRWDDRESLIEALKQWAMTATRDQIKAARRAFSHITNQSTAQPPGVLAYPQGHAEHHPNLYRVEHGPWQVLFYVNMRHRELRLASLSLIDPNA